jgi:hypothetical protein
MLDAGCRERMVPDDPLPTVDDIERDASARQTVALVMG